MYFDRILKIKKTRFFTLFFLIGIFLILFLSWKVNPNLKELPFIPEWLSNWTDHRRNVSLRTAIPFLGLGILVGTYINYFRRTVLNTWFFAWLILFGVVLLAEAGQFFLPSRSPDSEDLFWGGIGAAIGLTLTFLTLKLINRIRTIHFGNKKE